MPGTVTPGTPCSNTITGNVRFFSVKYCGGNQTLAGGSPRPAALPGMVVETTTPRWYSPVRVADEVSRSRVVGIQPQRRTERLVNVEVDVERQGHPSTMLSSVNGTNSNSHQRGRTTIANTRKNSVATPNPTTHHIESSGTNSTFSRNLSHRLSGPTGRWRRSGAAVPYLYYRP